MHGKMYYWTRNRLLFSSEPPVIMEKFTRIRDIELKSSTLIPQWMGRCHSNVVQELKILVFLQTTSHSILTGSMRRLWKSYQITLFWSLKMSGDILWMLNHGSIDVLLVWQFHLEISKELSTQNQLFLDQYICRSSNCCHLSELFLDPNLIMLQYFFKS